MQPEFNNQGQSMGNHCLLNLYGCDESKLKDLMLFEHFARTVLIKHGAVVKGVTSHKFPGPGFGFTSLHLLSTSHYSVHTWPETASAAVDVFTCGSVDARGICHDTLTYFGASTHELMCVLR